MDYKTLVVHLDQGARTAGRLETAFGLARAFDAHLVGLFALSEAHVPAYMLSEAGTPLFEATRRYRTEAANNAKAAFDAAAANGEHVETEWRASEQDALEAMCVNARYADLAIVGQRERDAERDDGLAPEFVGEFLLSAGRPVLVVPYAGRFAQIGRRVLIAWNAGQQAARAVTDALPLLARAEAVKVMVFDPEKGRADHGDIPGADIALYLARHGVKVSVAQQRCGSEVVGEQILSRAADMDADLIVMGAYGHSRVRELVLGGATRTLLGSMTVPVLMSH
jgi:nucleotide-binding universal stress UspA family protein